MAQDTVQEQHIERVAPPVPAMTLRRRFAGQLRAYRNHKELLLMFLPPMCLFVLFAYGPMYGIVIAFKDFTLLDGVWGSPWVGFENFRTLFGHPEFLNALTNDLVFTALKYVVEFPAPIILALLLNEVRLELFKRTVQSFSYLPHFFSWVILSSILFQFLAHDGGLNKFLGLFVGPVDTTWLLDPEKFKAIVVLAGTIQSVGWGSIIYLAAISGVNQELYEAAAVDGANRWHQVRHVTLPSIMPVIIIMLLLSLGQFLSVGFDRIYNLMTPTTQQAGDVLATFTLRQLFALDYSLGTAAGLFQAAIGLVMVLVANRLVKWYDGGRSSLW